MGAPVTEFVFESVIRDGLGELRATPSKLDDIFSRFLEAHFNNQYGQAKINEIKTYITNNQIRIVQSWAMVPTTVPCISIQLESSSEDPEIQNIGNAYLDEDESITPTVYVPVITPGTYDAVSGKLTVINSADLSMICPGMIFVDFAGTKFTILSGNSNLSGNKYINIGPAKEPDLSGDGKIESSLDKKRTERRMVRLRESIRLGCHAKDDVHLAKYIFYILTYILKSRQEALITRGIHLDWGQGSIYDRDDTFKGENIFSRFIKANCITEFDWDQKEVNLVDCFDLTIRANDPTPDSPGTIVVSPEDEE